MNQETLNKSLEVLDSAADELLQKSTKKSEDLQPEDISEDTDETTEKSKKSCENCDTETEIKKSEDTEDDDTEEETSEEDSDSEDDEDTKKSLDDFQSDINDTFYSDPDVSNGAGSSEFQAGIVAAMAKSLAEIQYDIYNNNKGNNNIAGVLAKSLNALITSNNTLRTENDKLLRRVSHLEKSLDQKFDSIMDALDSFSSQPAQMRKSIGSISVHDRNFNTSLTGTQTTDFQSMSKSQVLDILSQQLYSGNTMVRPDDIISYESGAPLRPELQSLVVKSYNN